MSLSSVMLRFQAKVEPLSQFDSVSCWNWMANKSSDGLGYGKVKILGKYFRAHRVIWEWVNGPIPDGMQVLHKCDNPSCVNPSHLFLGTQLDNMRDKTLKGRHFESRKTHCPHGHEYTPENTYTAPSVPNQRACRVCRRKKMSDYYLKYGDRRKPKQQ